MSEYTPKTGRSNRNMKMEVLCLLSKTPVDFDSLLIDLKINEESKLRELLAGLGNLGICLVITGRSVKIHQDNWLKAYDMAMRYSNTRQEYEHTPAM